MPQMSEQTAKIRAEKASATLHLRLSRSALEAIHGIAAKEGLRASSFARKAIMRALAEHRAQQVSW